MQIKIVPILLEEDKHKRQRRVLSLAHVLEELFPWPAGPFHSVRFSMDQERIWLIWLGSLSVEQVSWLESSPLVIRWNWSAGGLLSIENQTPTTQSPLSTFFYEQKEGVMAHITLAPVLGCHLHVKPSGQYSNISSEGHLKEILQDAKLPLEDGWTQRIRLCCRCDRPGASPLSSLCMECEDAYKLFISFPIPEYDVGTKELLAERRLSLAFELREDEIEAKIQDEIEEVIKEEGHV